MIRGFALYFLGTKKTPFHTYCYNIIYGGPIWADFTQNVVQESQLSAMIFLEDLHVAEDTLL